MNDSSNFYKRRNLLKGIAITSGVSLFKLNIVEQIVNNLISNANAAPLELPNFKYINFFTRGGAPRWYFDLPIAPNGNDEFLLNPHVITSMEMNTKNITNGKYQHVKIGKYYLPKLWSFKVPLSGGGFGTLQSLAESGLFIRGIHQGIDGHSFNIIKQNSPVSGGLTFTGAFADTANNPIPSVFAATTPEHRSAKNKSITSFNYLENHKVLSESFKSFKTNNPTSFNHSASDAINLSVKAIQNNHSKNSIYLSGVAENIENAKELLAKDFEAADEQYNLLFNKYYSLAERALKMILPGITDSPIIASDRDPKFDIASVEGKLKAPEKKYDIREAFLDLKISDEFAHSFALAEYLIVNKLSSSVFTGLEMLENFNPKNFFDINDKLITENNKRAKLNFDSHFSGTYTALIYFTKHFHAYATCLNEFVNILKNKKLYNDSIIHTSSDFNRLPDANGYATGHGYEGCATSFFTGRVKNGPIVVGNIEVGKVTKGYGSGTWGKAVTENGANNNLANVSSTICKIFEMNPIAPNGIALVNLDPNTKMVSEIPSRKPKNIAV